MLISFDAVGSRELDTLRTLPNFRRLADAGTLRSDIKTIFVSNTYPIHTSVATGKLPGEHGIFSNTELTPETASPRWHYDSRLIQVKTLWQAAHERGLKVATILWPVTGYAKEIAWNVPESRAQPGENQIVLNLRAGSKRSQLKAYLRHRKLLDGINQPQLDRFTTATALDILYEHRPDLTMVHLTGYDAFCHQFGRDSAEALAALAALDKHLGKLSNAAGKDTTVIVFSDHAQLNVRSAVNPNRLLHEQGYLSLTADGAVRDARAFFDNADGSAFFLNRSLSPNEVEAVKQQTLALSGVRRLLRPDELLSAGYPGAIFGIAAEPGFCFSAKLTHRATHGYPPDYPDYAVFYLISEHNVPVMKGNILDIPQYIAESLQLSL